MSWSAIKGQPLAVRLLRQALAANKLAHAYLFAGPQGVGKRLTAMELAKTLTCLSPRPDGSACDSCVSCRKMATEPPVHPDLMLVTPDGRFIKTDQMRELQSEMYARPTEGRARIAIIDGAERLNAEAGNRVLKLLEEPPPFALFLLLTHNLAGVLPTIVSRCQIVNFPPLSTDEVARFLQEERQLEGGQARLYAALSGGSIGRAVAMASSPEIAQRRDETCDLLLHLPSLDDADLLARAEALERQKDSLDSWLEMLTVWLRDGLVLAQGAPEGLAVNADRLAEARRIAQRYGSSSLMLMLEAVSETRGQLMRNANTRLALDVMMLRLFEAAQTTTAVL
ncbi:MAG: DNA polymerase III subunit delta' [Bacillota bacterium]